MIRYFYLHFYGVYYWLISIVFQAWGIRLILEALISFLPSPADGAIGALNWTAEERKKLAKASSEYCCARCGNIAALLRNGTEEKEEKVSSLSSEIEKLHMLQRTHHHKRACGRHHV